MLDSTLAILAGAGKRKVGRAVKFERRISTLESRMLSDPVILRFPDASTRHFRPAGPLESLLVDGIVSNTWRLQKVLEMESWYQKYHASRYLSRPQTETFPGLQIFESGDGHLKDIFEQGGKLTRYESFLERSLHRSLHELQRFQAARAESLSRSPQPWSRSLRAEPEAMT